MAHTQFLATMGRRTLRSTQGAALASYYFPHSGHEVGGVVDGVPDQELSMVAARFIDKDDHFVTVLTWLKAR